MRKICKRFLTTALCSATVAAAGLGLNALTTDVVKAEESNVEFKIAGQTLNVSDNVNVVYLISAEVGAKSDITVYVTENGEKTAIYADAENKIYDGDEYYRFIYRGITAYEMDTALYAYAEMGDEKTETVKYSVLQYAYTKLGMADKPADTTKEGLDTLLTAMLNYGSAAANYKGVDIDLLADYTYVSVEHATFADGFAYGLYKKDAELTITPDMGWKLADDAGECFTVEGETITFTVPESAYVNAGAFVENDSITAQDKVDYEADLVNVDITTAYVGDTLALNTEVDAYEDVSIVWAATGATLEEGVVTFDTVGTATLTATITCGSVSVEKTFSVVVSETDAQKVAVEENALTLVESAYVGDTVELPTIGATYAEVEITWAGAGVADGEVTFNAEGTVELTATITCGGVSVEKAFSVVVSKTDAQKVAAEKDALTMAASAYEGDTVALPVSGKTYTDVVITWAGAGVADNQITFNTVGTVELTATITCGDESDTKTFSVVVSANPYPIEGKAYALKTSSNYYIVGTSNNNSLTVGAENDDSNVLQFYFVKVADAQYAIYYEANGTRTYIAAENENVVVFSKDPYTWNLDLNKKEIVTADELARELAYNSTAAVVRAYKQTTTTASNYHNVWFEEVREWTDADKIDYEVENFTAAYETNGGVDLPLPTHTEKFEANISWALAGEYDFVVSLENGVLVTTNPAEDAVVNVTATISLNGVNSEEIDCTITVKHIAEGGDEPAKPTTIQVTMANNGWTNAKQYKTLNMDDNITVTVSGNSNSGKYYTSDKTWRLYAGESAKLQITAGNGKTIVSVKITFALADNGKFTYNNSTITSNSVINVGAATATFAAGHASGTKGKVFITAIEVIYQ